MIIYTSLLKRGITVAPWLVIIPKWAKGKASYLAHEMVHVGQQREHGVIGFWFKYITKKDFRQAMEVPAYRAEIASGASLDNCAWQLHSVYGLNIPIQEAYSLLVK